MTSSIIVPVVGVTLLLAVAIAFSCARRATVLLTLKYLIKRRLAWVSLVAVILCVALVLIVLSVMGGWLQMFRASFKTMSGDLIVSRSSLTAFPYYDEMIAEFATVPGVEASIPVIQTAGLLYLTPSWQHYVGVVGFPEPTEVDRVMNFTDSLWLQHGIAQFDKSGKPRREPASFKLWDGVDYADLNPKDPQSARRPGIILGGGAIGVKKDKVNGKPDWPVGMEGIWGRLTVVPTDNATGSSSLATINAVTTPYWVVDGSRTQTMQHDENVYVPFAQLQKDLGLSERPPYEDIQTGKMVRDPARTTEIHIKVKAGVDPVSLRAALEEKIVKVYAAQEGAASQPDKISLFGDPEKVGLHGLRVETWQEQQKTWLNAIENEIALVTTLFSFISVVAVFLVFCIFYMIVVEKTRDIGILKSVGARAWDVAQIFLAYGTAIGFVGGGLGVLLGSVIVWNINWIHMEMGKQLGIEIWNSDVYAFDKIPNEININAAIIIWLVAIVAAVVGAVLPAIRAALLNPVESLRFE